MLPVLELFPDRWKHLFDKEMRLVKERASRPITPDREKLSCPDFDVFWINDN